MSSTDAALSWLLSLDAACTSSPFPTSASPNFTDWLHISPTANSPSTEPTSLPASDNLLYREVLVHGRDGFLVGLSARMVEHILTGFF